MFSENNFQNGNNSDFQIETTLSRIHSAGQALLRASLRGVNFIDLQAA